MECKKIGNGNPISSLVGSILECKKLTSTVKSRTTVFAIGFAFTLLFCSIFFAFNYPDKIVMNPMGQRQSWFPSIFSNSSRSKSFFSFIFPSSVSSTTPNLTESDTAFQKNPQDMKKLPHDQKGMDKNGLENMDKGSNTNKTEDILVNTKNGTEYFNSTGIDVPDVIPINSTDGNGGKQGAVLGQGDNQEIVPKQNNSSQSLSGSPVITPDLDSSTNSAHLKPEEISNGSSVPVEKKKCDIFSGRWVRDYSYPHYPAGSCPHIDESFNCFINKRPDNHYEKWRWQPNDCDIPRLNATDMLERLRGKRLVFVGDSLNRNMWESLVCILRHSVSNKSRVHEISGRKQFRTEGFYAFLYEDYNCTVEFIRAPFLVQEWEMDGVNRTKKETLRLDLLESSVPKSKKADIIVFNTGHWWTHEKTSKGMDYYQEGDHVYPELKVLEAYRKALTTWAKWVDMNINPERTQVFFRGYSATHFRGGQWNSGGQCHKETEPIYNETYLSKYSSKMIVLESVIKEMKTPIMYLNITRITDYRKDGHPSIYRRIYLSQEEKIASERYQDCSHWCLPGVPDTWNELLYASMLMKGQGMWAS
eukprot:Gb_27485 [translate_table: standard]